MRFPAKFGLVFSLGLSWLGYPSLGVFEKMPGATNPAISPGEAFDFQCNPPEANSFINEKGQLWKNGKPKRKLGESVVIDTIVYLECFIIGNQVIAVYRESNGEDGSVGARRIT